MASQCNMQQLIAMGEADQLELSIGVVHLLNINIENFSVKPKSG